VPEDNFIFLDMVVVLLRIFGIQRWRVAAKKYRSNNIWHDKKLLTVAPFLYKVKQFNLI
jgi:hypothetical protein